jgi:hypothetical protein
MVEVQGEADGRDADPGPRLAYIDGWAKAVHDAGYRAYL